MKAANARSLADALGFHAYPQEEPAEDVTSLPAADAYPMQEVAEDFAELELGDELLGSSVFTPHGPDSLEDDAEERRAMDAGAMEAFSELQAVYQQTLARVQELEQHNEDLTQQLQSANIKIARHDEQSRNILQRNTELTQQLEQFRQQTFVQEQTSEDRTSTLQNVIDQLREQGQTTDEALRNARQEIDVLDHRVKSQANELEVLHQSEQQLQQQVHELNAQLRSAHSTTQDELVSLDEKLAKTSTETTMLRRRKAELELQVDELMNDNNRLKLQLQNSELLQHQLQRNQEMRYSMPEFTPAPLPPPAPFHAAPTFASSQQPTLLNGRGGFRDSGYDRHHSDAFAGDDMSLSRSVDHFPARDAPRASNHPRPSTADPMTSQPIPEYSAYRHDAYPPQTAPSRPKTLAEVAGASMATSLSFPNEHNSAGSVRSSLNYARRQQPERSPFATTDTAQELEAFEDLERKLTSIQFEKKSLDAEYSKLYPRATKTLQDKVRIKRIEARLEEIGKETSELRRQLSNKPA